MSQSTPPPNFAVNYSFEDIIDKYGYKILSTIPYGPSGFAIRFRSPDGIGTMFMTQADSQEDDVEYLHASIAFEHRMPTYPELVMLHRAVFGRRRWAYQVFAPHSEHVNIHEHALHLWGRADGKPVLPNFGSKGTI